MEKSEYKKLKERDMSFAESIMEDIRNSKDPDVRYRDRRAIMDLKHMLETSCSDALYADNVCMYQKFHKTDVFRRITFRQVLEMVNALGTKLIDMGFKDKRIAVIGENCSQWAVSYLATVCGTGVCVPLDKELAAKDIEQLLIRSEVRCVFTTKKRLDVFEDIVKKKKTKVKTIICLDSDEEKNALSFSKLIDEGKELIASGDRRFLDAEIDATEMAVIIFTSGTTGIPKGVMLSHRNLVADVMYTPSFISVYTDDIFFSVLPVHHTYECTAGFLVPIYCGAAIAYCEGLKYIVKNLEEVRPTVFLGVPAIFEILHKRIWKTIKKQGKERLVRSAMALNRATKKARIDIGKRVFKQITDVFGGRMRILITGGAAIDPVVIEDMNKFGITMLQGYGMTECAPIGALNPEAHDKPASIGKAFSGCKLRIDKPDEDGIGEIMVYGDNVMLGYYDMPEETAKVKDGKWLRTGDLGYMDDEGYVFITGRAKNIIITKNGKNVSPEELEHELAMIDIIKETMVFAEESKYGADQVICAAIRLDDDEVQERYGEEPDMKEIEKDLWDEIDEINAEQPIFKQIRRIIIRKEDFVKNSSQKIIRFAEENKRDASQEETEPDSSTE